MARPLHFTDIGLKLGVVVAEGFLQHIVQELTDCTRVLFKTLACKVAGITLSFKDCYLFQHLLQNENFRQEIE